MIIRKAHHGHCRSQFPSGHEVRLLRWVWRGFCKEQGTPAVIQGVDSKIDSYLLKERVDEHGVRKRELIACYA